VCQGLDSQQNHQPFLTREKKQEMFMPANKLAWVTRYLSAFILLALVLGGLSAAGAQAAGNPVDLELSGAGASSWNISNVKPGDAGAILVTLKNAGTKAGAVTIWLSDIVSTEGNNPESETGDTSEPGELDAYLVINLTSSRLTTNITLPVALNQFPQSPSGPAYVKLSQIGAGESINVTWHWSLPPGANNDVQGDSVSFTINYVIEELPAPPGGGGGNGTAPANSYELLIISKAGELSSSTYVGLSELGRTQQALSVSDIYRSFTLTIEGGTLLTSNEIEIPRILRITRSDELLQALGNGITIISPLYEIAALIGNREYGYVAFDQPARITLRYDARLVPDRDASIFIGILCSDQTIIKLPTEVGTDADGAYAQAITSTLATVAVFAEMPLPASKPASAVPAVPPAHAGPAAAPPGPGGASLITPQDAPEHNSQILSSGDGVTSSGQKDVSPAKKNDDTPLERKRDTGHLLITILTIFGYVVTSIILLIFFVFRTRPS
jgi:hypothetical protein